MATPAATTFSISSVLEKMSNRDKDFRFMATSDLAAELVKDTFKMDADSEKKICAAVVQLLDDSSGDVQGLAVKCLGPLISKIKEPQLQIIVDTLGDYILQTKKSELRDIAGIGLKTVVAQTPPESATAPLVVQRVTPKLLKGISQEVPETILECLSVLSDLLKRFATLMNQDHEKIQKAIIPHLTSTRVATRKKAISCLGYLSISTPDKLFAELITYILGDIKSSKKANHIRTLISVIGAISRSVGFRLGKFLESEGIIPLLVKYLHDDRFKTDDELRENTFQTFESLVLRCPAEIKPFLNDVIEQSLEFIKYDPNYDTEAQSDGDEEGGSDEEGSGGEDEEEEASDGEEYSDDEDMSWKIRRASAKCLASIVLTRADLLEELYKKVVPTLVARFREREENVKLDIFATFADVLRQTQLVSRGSRNDEEGVLALLKSNIPAVVANLSKDLKSKGTKVKTRVGIFQLLRELITVYPGCLSAHIGDIVAGVTVALAGKGTNASTKLEALSFLRLLLSTHKPEIFHPHIKAVSEPVFKAVKDNYYKITAEALRVSSHLVVVIRPFGTESSLDFKPYASKVYESIFEKYNAQDIDQEVKEAAINCMGLTIAHLGDGLPADSLKKGLDILLERLKNEITRLTSVNALIEIANSPLKIDLKAILADAVAELAAFLRQNNRQLKQSSLKALADLIKTYGDDIKGKLLESVLNEVANLISDADLHLAHLSLHLVGVILVADPKSVSIVQSKIYPQVLVLVQSSVLQGLALESLLTFYSSLVAADAKKFGFGELLDSLLGLALKASQSTKQGQSNVAKCVAALCVNASADQKNATVERFIADIKKKKEGARVQPLLALGEIGRRVDLSSHRDVQQVILSAFEGTEDEKSAASFALGNVAVGNVRTFLPPVLKEISENPKKQYLLMHSLEEIISRSTGPEAAKALLPHLGQVMELLFNNTDKEEEGIRTVVAKCMGKFAMIAPEEIVPALQKKLKDESPHTRYTVVTAVKFAIDPHPHPVDAAIAPMMAQLLPLLADPDVEVRRAVLLTVNYVAHNKPAFIRPVLAEHLNLLFEETKVKKELIKVVDLGPFKHKVDEGLENRKAAFECLYTLLDTCIDKLDIGALTAHLVSGLGDIHDIQLLCHLMLIRMAQHAPAPLLTGLDQLIEPLKKTINTKVNQTAVKQQVDRNEELIRSSLRAIAAISRIPDFDSAVRFDEFIKQTVKTSPYAEQYDNILKETAPKAASE